MEAKVAMHQDPVGNPRLRRFVTLQCLLDATKQTSIVDHVRQG